MRKPTIPPPETSEEEKRRRFFYAMLEANLYDATIEWVCPYYRLAASHTTHPLDERRPGQDVAADYWPPILVKTLVHRCQRRRPQQIQQFQAQIEPLY